MSKSALITGVSGQDAFYLSELLLGKGYTVHGLVRHVARAQAMLDPRIVVHVGDLLDQQSLVRAIEESEPNEVYNLAAMSFVPASWAEPTVTGEITGLGVVRMLEAIRQVNPKIRFYQASSSEMFGNVVEEPQNEQTPFYPRSPYGVAKCYGHFITVNYRESYGIFACCGILYNHESPLRGLQFVTRKITDAAARIKAGRETVVRLGNLDVRRDWGFAGDYVRAMWMMLQQDEPDDYVVATGDSHTVEEFLTRAFRRAGLVAAEHLVLDPSLRRPAEVVALRGDASKARRRLGWEPTVDFAGLVDMMVDADLAAQGVANG